MSQWKSLWVNYISLLLRAAVAQESNRRQSDRSPWEAQWSCTSKISSTFQQVGILSKRFRFAVEKMQICPHLLRILSVARTNKPNYRRWVVFLPLRGLEISLDPPGFKSTKRTIINTFRMHSEHRHWIVARETCTQENIKGLGAEEGDKIVHEDSCYDSLQPYAQTQT